MKHARYRRFAFLLLALVLGIALAMLTSPGYLVSVTAAAVTGEFDHRTNAPPDGSRSRPGESSASESPAGDVSCDDARNVIDAHIPHRILTFAGLFWA